MSPVGGHQDGGGWSTGSARGGCGSWVCLAWRKDGFRTVSSSPLVLTGKRLKRWGQVLSSGVRWLRQWAKVQTRQVQIHIRRKNFPHEDIQTIDPLQRSCTVSVLEGFQTQLGKALSNLFWSHRWPCFGGEVALETSWGPFPPELCYHSGVTAWLKCQLKAERCNYYPAPCLHFQSTACDYAT